MLISNFALCYLRLIIIKLS